MMMPISTKLALLVFVLPLSLLIISDIVLFSIFRVLYIDVVVLFTSNWVFLLVWERLRESLSKKMEYLHENFIFDLYTGLKVYEDNINAYFWADADKIKRNRLDLEKYSRFLGINLFPKKLFSRIDQFISSSESLLSNTETVMELGANMVGGVNFNKNTFLHSLGFPISGINPNKASRHQEVAEEIKEKNLKLLKNMKKDLNNLIENREEIIPELEDFLKANNLKLRQKPAYTSISYP